MRAFLALLLAVSGVATAAESKPVASPVWKFSRVVDKMTDKVTCVLRAPDAKLGLQFQVNGKRTTVYLNSRDLKLLDGRVSVKVRVDKNPPLDTYYDWGSPTAVAAFEQDAFAKKWFAAMASGKSVVVRLSSKGGVTIEEEYTLDGFNSSLVDYNACLKAA